MAIKSYETEDIYAFPEELSEKQRKQLLGYVSKSATRFAGVDFKQGYKELKKKVKDDKKATEAFVAMFSNNQELIISSFKKCNIQPQKTAIFWSGEKGQKTATLYAMKKGYKRLEHTPMGFFFDNWGWYNKKISQNGRFWNEIDKGTSAKPLWQALSQVFAEKCRPGQNVVAFMNEEKLKNANTIWNKIEKPTLIKNNVAYKIYTIKPTDKPIDICNRAIDES